MMDRNGSDEEEEDYDMNKAGIYRPPRVAAVPYSEGPPKGTELLFYPSRSLIRFTKAKKRNEFLRRI